MNDSKLKLVPKRKPQKNQLDSFWTTCPISAQLLPTSPCDHGKPSFKGKKLDGEPSCPWWINSEKHMFCYWRYIRDNSASDGSMKELQLSDIAKLLGWSSTKAHFIMKEAMEELAEVFKRRGINTQLLLEEDQNIVAIASDYTMVDPE